MANPELGKYLQIPDFFKKITYRNSNSIMTDENRYSVLQPINGDLLYKRVKCALSNSTSLQKFNVKKQFYDILTDFVSRILTNENQKNIFDFQSLVITKFNHIFSLYKQEFNLTDEMDIFFEYKGGTTMRILTDPTNGAYKDFYNNLINEGKINNYFNRSDSDYSVNLEKNVDNFNFHYYNICVIIYNILSEIQEHLNIHIDNYFDLTLITEEAMIDLIRQANQTLINIKRDTTYRKYRDIKAIVGVQIFDKMYYDINNKIQFIDGKKVNYRIKDLFQITHNKSRPENFTSKLLNIKNKDYYIAFDNNNLYSNHISVVKKNIYMSVNETSIIKSDLVGDAMFNLFRLKISSGFIYITQDNKFGILKSPSELIDISFPKIVNPLTYQHHKRDNYLLYNYNTRIGTLQFYGFSLSGFIHDLYYILYQITDYQPWANNKYEKRLYRFLLFCVYKIYQMTDKYEERFTLILNLKDILITKDTPPHPIFSADPLFSYIYIGLSNVLKNKPSDSLTKYLRIIEINFFNVILTYLDKIPSRLLVEDGNINYLEKYIKYKTKYFNLLMAIQRD